MEKIRGWRLFKITRRLELRFWPTVKRSQPSQGDFFARIALQYQEVFFLFRSSNSKGHVRSCHHLPFISLSIYRQSNLFTFKFPKLLNQMEPGMVLGEERIQISSNEINPPWVVEVVYRSSEILSNQSDISVRSNYGFLNLVVDSDS